MENMDADIGQNDATLIFLRFPTPTTHRRKVSATITLGDGSSRSRSLSNGASIRLIRASKNAVMSAARTRSEGTTLGMELKRMLSGLASEPIKPSHSSVTTKVTWMSLFLETSKLQRFIIGFMWPRPGKGMATTWQILFDSAPADSMSQKF